MALRKKVSSNETSLLYAVETLNLPGVLPTNTTWAYAEPNSYNDFGGETSLIARNIIRRDRQRLKGKVNNVEAMAGFVQDYTLGNSKDFFESFLFALTREKTNADVTAVSGSSYTVSDGTVFQAGMLVLAKGFDTAANNGLKLVTATGATTVSVAGLTAEASPTNASIKMVGVELGADDATTTATGLPTLAQSTFDLTTLGIVPGQWVFIGGDATANQMTGAGNNGFKRVKTISATTLVFDISEIAMSAETLSGGETLRIFTGDFLRNEKQPPEQVVKSFTFERRLGAPDSVITDEQAEYVSGAVADELTIDLPEAGLVTFDMNFTPLRSDTIAAGDTLLSEAGTATVIDLEEGEAFSTAGDMKSAVLYTIDASGAVPSSLFAFASEASIEIKNNNSKDMALGVIGAFDITSGTFEVSGSIEAYFVEVAAIEAVRASLDTGFYLINMTDNSGSVMDLPLIALSGGKLEIELNEPIKVPLETNAATARKYGADLDYTIGITTFNYLPDLADT